MIRGLQMLPPLPRGLGRARQPFALDQTCSARCRCPLAGPPLQNPGL